MRVAERLYQSTMRHAQKQQGDDKSHIMTGDWALQS